MSTRHGNKFYYQLLLDPFRGHLIDKMAAKSNIRATALLREVIYDFLQRNLPSNVYEEAVRRDMETWSQSVQNRVAGRSKTGYKPPRLPEPIPGGETEAWNQIWDEIKRAQGARATTGTTDTEPCK